MRRLVVASVVALLLPAVAADGAISESALSGLASGLATTVGKSLLQPFDTIKTVQQTNSSATFGETARALVREGGPLALYRGLPFSLPFAVPSMAVYFAVYSAAKRALLEGAPSAVPRLLLVAVAAALGNFVASGVRVPGEVMKQRLQARVYATPLGALRAMHAAGRRGFFPPGALAAQFARDVPFGVFALVAYEALDRGGTRRSLRGAVRGAAAGAIATVLTQPMDVVKTRTIVTAKTSLAKIFREEGPAALLSGVGARLAHKMPGSALFWFLFEAFKYLLGVGTAAS